MVHANLAIQALTAHFEAQGQDHLAAEGAAIELVADAPAWIVERYHADAPAFVAAMDLRTTAFPAITRRFRR